MLRIRFKGKELRAPRKYIFSYTYPQHVAGLKGKTIMNEVMLHIKLRGKKYKLLFCQATHPILGILVIVLRSEVKVKVTPKQYATVRHPKVYPHTNTLGFLPQIM